MNALPSTVLLHPVGPAAIDPVRRPRPIGAVRAQLGFPSPAEDFEDDTLDLNALLIRNEPSTFYYRCEGWSMLLAGICDGDLVAIDRTLTPGDGDLVLAMWDGNAPACKFLRIRDDRLEFHSASADHPVIVLTEETEVEVFAVIAVVRQVKPHR